MYHLSASRNYGWKLRIGCLTLRADVKSLLAQTTCFDCLLCIKGRREDRTPFPVNPPGHIVITPSLHSTGRTKQGRNSTKTEHPYVKPPKDRIPSSDNWRHFTYVSRKSLLMSSFVDCARVPNRIWRMNCYCTCSLSNHTFKADSTKALMLFLLHPAT